MLFLDNTVFSRDVNFILKSEFELNTTLTIAKSIKNFHRFSSKVKVVDSHGYNISEFVAANRFTLVTCDKNVYEINKSMGIDCVLTSPEYNTKYIELNFDIYKHKRVSVELPLQENEYFIGSGALCLYTNGVVQLLSSDNDVMGIKPKNKGQHFAMDALVDEDIKLVFITGVAGTGKTLLSIAAGLEQTLNEGLYNKIIVSRPNVSLGMDLGYLPGSMEEKMSPWLMPIEDNINMILSNTRMDDFDTLKTRNQVEVQPLAFIRGRSLSKSFIVIDEAQNLSEHEIKTILTRAGDGTKIVMTGDPEQVDIGSSGLLSVIEKMKGDSIVAHVHLTKTERSRLAELSAKNL